MKYVIIAIFGLWWLWLPLLAGLWSLVNNIKDKIEGKKIKSSGVYESINAVYERIMRDADVGIQQSRESYNNLQLELCQRLPGLKDRMTRDDRKRDYMRNVLPYKKKNRYYRYY